MHGHWSVQRGPKLGLYWKDPWYLVFFTFPLVCGISFLFLLDSDFCPLPVLGVDWFLADILSASLVVKREASFFIFGGLPSAVVWAYVLLDLATKSSGIRGTK